MQLFYKPELDLSVSQFSLGPEESKHLVKVLRKKEGDQIHLTNGKGILFTAEIIEANPKRSKMALVDSEKHIQKMHSLHMAVCLLYTSPSPRDA